MMTAGEKNEKNIHLLDPFVYENKTKMHKAVKKVANKNIKLIKVFQELHPEWKKITSKVSDQMNKIIIEAMGGPGDNDFEKEEKIIKKIAKEIIIYKD